MRTWSTGGRRLSRPGWNAGRRLASLGGAVAAAALLLAGCGDTTAVREYGRESQVVLALSRPHVWAVAPAVNLSGQPSVDPLLQADLVYQQLQQVQGLTVIPVDRVVEALTALGLNQVRTAEQAQAVCEVLGADALLIPTVTAWDPYDPPKMGATLSLFVLPGRLASDVSVDPRALARRATPMSDAETGGFDGGAAVSGGGGRRGRTPGSDGFFQASGMFDASHGSVREALFLHAYGRTEPLGPYGMREFLVSSDRYASFVYRQLTLRLFDQVFFLRSPAAPPGVAGAGESGGRSGSEAFFPQGGPAGPQPFPSNRR
ncbi:MAG: hypothetical protein ACK4PI_04075 [Tepidisphaerales bacterium]